MPRGVRSSPCRHETRGPGRSPASAAAAAAARQIAALPDASTVVPFVEQLASS